MDQCHASPFSEEHTAWGAITVTPPEPLSAVYTKHWFGLISSHPKKIIHTIGFLPCFSKSKLTTVDETQGLGRTLCRDYFNHQQLLDPPFLCSLANAMQIEESEVNRTSAFIPRF